MTSAKAGFAAARGRLRAALAAACALALLTVAPPTSGTPATGASAVSTVVDPAVTASIQADGAADVIVQATPGAVGAVATAVVAGGGEVGIALPLVDGFAARVTAASLERLLALGPEAVRAVTLDGAVRFDHVPGDGEAFSDSSFVETIGADVLHAAGADGSGVGIAIVDTGVSPVGDLDGRLGEGIDLSGESDGVDRYGHGTFVAGVAASSGAASGGEHAGVAPGAHVVPVKIAGADGSADVSQVLAALQWVVAFRDVHDIDVLNLSFGTDSTQSYRADPVNYAVERAWDAGIVVVVAAGNTGPDARTVFKPADDPLVITAGATDSNGTVERDDDVVADFSARGPTRTNNLAKPDLVAPGAHIIGLRSPGSTVDSTFPEARVGEHYFRGSGTSFAAAATSGAAALLLELNPQWTPDDVKGALLDLVAAGPSGDRNADGHGALDLRGGLNAAPTLDQSGVKRSNGLGSLQASRGSLRVELGRDGGERERGERERGERERGEREEDDRERANHGEGNSDRLDGERTFRDRRFDARAFTRHGWDAADWSGTQWW
ncbi:MAG: S8 family serine peptidase, partial [Nitriliruptorales bacterium]